MDDVISQRADREPSWWPRRLAVTAVLVVLASVAVRDLPRGGDSPAHHPAALVTAGPVQLAGLGSAAAGLLDKTDGNHRAGHLRRRAASGGRREQPARGGRDWPLAAGAGLGRPPNLVS
jgi:hypothetical protein